MWSFSEVKVELARHLIVIVVLARILERGVKEAANRNQPGIAIGLCNRINSLWDR